MIWCSQLKQLHYYESSALEITSRKTLSWIRSIRAVMSLKPARFSWVIHTKLAASGKPSSRLQLSWLARRKLTAILDLTENLIHIYRRHSGTYLKIPIQEHSKPSLIQLIEAVNFIQERNNSGEAVLVHCLAGLGRTGTVLACYLIKKQGMQPEEAIDLVREKRPGSIERSQEESVSDYFRFLNAQTR